MKPAQEAWIIIFVIFVVGVLTIALSSTDDNECVVRDADVSIYRTFGDGVGRNYSKWKSSSTCPSHAPAECGSGSPYTKHTSELLWAWLMFVAEDISDPIWGDEICNSSYPINQATPLLDASHLYGVSSERLQHLRKMDGSGKLDTFTTPYTYDVGDSSFFFNFTQPHFSGLVTALKVLFIREHNWWCDRLASDDVDDWWIFMQARSIVIAEIQSITYKEMLPLLGIASKSYTCFSWSRKPLRTSLELALVFEMWRSRDARPNITEDWLLQNGIGHLLLNASRQELRLEGGDVLDFVSWATRFGVAPYSSYADHLLHHHSCNAEFLAGAAVDGSVARYLMRKEFAAIREHDPWFYHWNPNLHGRRPAIDAVSLSAIIRRNTDIQHSQISPQVFKLKK